MANPYTSVSISGYNANPPSDDGASTSTNEVEWAKHINKIGDPVKTLGETINTNVSTAFDKIFLNNISAHSANYTVQISDQGKLLSCTSTITITLLAASSAGSNFAIGVRNAGVGVITVDGNSSETINGSTTITLNPEDVLIICSNASQWEGFFIQDESNLTAATTTNSGIVELAIDAEVQAGTDSVRAITPSGLDSYVDTAATVDTLVKRNSGGGIDIQHLVGVSNSFTEFINVSQQANSGIGSTIRAIEAQCLPSTTAPTNIQGVYARCAFSGSASGLIPIYGEINNTGYTNSYGVRGDCTSGTGNFDFYAGGAATNYGPFTGGHEGLVNKDFIGVEGDIICDIDVINKANISNCIMLNDLNKSSKDPTIIGVLTQIGNLNIDHLPSALINKTDGKNNGPIENIKELSDNYLYINFNALGEGQINICNENGDIKRGDYICSSSIPGKGMKQDSTSIHNYTVAKAREDYSFKKNEIVKIACVYVSG